MSKPRSVKFARGALVIRVLIRPRLKLAAISLIVAMSLPIPLVAKAKTMKNDAVSTVSGYQSPPQAIADLIDAPLTPMIGLSPNRQTLLIMERQPLLTLTDLAQPELRLAGMRFNPQNSAESRAGYYTKLSLQTLSTGKVKPVKGLPKGARIGAPTWAADSAHFAFSVTTQQAVELWVCDMTTAQARRLGDIALNAITGRPYQWMPDGRHLLCRVIPDKRGKAPIAPATPLAPVTQENLGKKAPARTYTDLLQNSHDENRFEFHARSQIAKIDLQGKAKLIGKPAIIGALDPSPDGRYLLVKTLHRPFSYLVPVGRFPIRVEVWDAQGKALQSIADLPLAEEIPVAFDAVRAGRRSIDWRADAPATLYWVEALDGGDPANAVEHRDGIYFLPAPFTAPPNEWMKLSYRASGIYWGNDDLAIVSESWWKTRREKTWILKPGNLKTTPQLLHDRTFEDRYNDPGDFLLTRGPRGTFVLQTTPDGRSLFLVGEGASTEGNRPFLDRFDWQTKETKRLWRSEAPYYESPVSLLDETGDRILTRRESPQEQPNYFIRGLGKQSLDQITHFPHPYPHLSSVKKELVVYERADGVKLNGTLYLPPNYNPDQGRLPVLIWIYPQEFKSADAAGQITDSPYQFDRLFWGSPLLWLTQGYAVFDGPTLPIVGQGEMEPNDTYVEQLVSGAKAAVDIVVKKGVGDPKRFAVGGHSYGAFTTANLLAHSDLFCAGIGRSGAYNRTLTPFGFQAEERTLWQAPETYFKLSPFVYADKIKKPLLLIHGASDENSGTYPVQSERLYQALKGLGGTSRLVMLPLEGHGYRARESVLHMAHEMNEWLEQYVKNAPKP